jgi:lipoprotein-releasing system ATP-binding protein
MAFIEIRDLSKSYWLHGKRIDVLRGLSLDIERGELVSLVGASGSGKSTFLHVLGTLDAPVAGTMTVDGVDVLGLPDADLARFPQPDGGLRLPEPLPPAGVHRAGERGHPALVQRMERPRRCDARGGCWTGWGWAPRWTNARRAVGRRGAAGGAGARAGARAAVLLADEPTGNLDPVTGEGIHQVLREVNRDLGITAVVVTHNEALARSLPRRLRLAGGKVEPA